MALAAQTTTPSQASDWRQANEAVAAFKRGHIDVLKWEQANAKPAAEAQAPTGTPLGSAEAAVRMAWQAHRALAHPLAELGAQQQERLAQGRWTEVDPSLLRRIDDMDEVLEVAASARKAWLQAVAAQQVVHHHHDMQDTAQAALELGQRMVTVGNWSKLQLAPVQLTATQARMNLRRAQLAAAQAQAELVKVLGLTGAEDGFVLPNTLPALPPQPMAAAELQQRALAVQTQLPTTHRPRNRALVAMATDVYEAAHQLAGGQAELLTSRELITEETLLHYNGMLKGVWELLTEVRNQSQARVDAIGAQRDFWLAEADLQWVLLGGEPNRWVSLSGAAGDAPAAAAH